jgi:hypothetical protein
MIRLASFILFIPLFISCSSGNSKENMKTDEKPSSETNTRGNVSSDTRHKHPIKNNADSCKWEDCVRGEPEAICHKNAFKNHSFRVDSTTSAVHIGHEKATLKNGDVLEIQNAGCEYYVLEFTFTTSRFKADTTDLVYWCDAAIQLMKSIEKNVDAPVMIADSYAVLEKYYLESEAPELGVQQPVNDSEIGTYVSIERIEKLSRSKYAITVRYAVGPL